MPYDHEQLKSNEHTQGENIVSKGTMNFWIRYGESPDSKYHVHLYSNSYGIILINIIAKKNKIRKFSIRCVKDNVSKSFLFSNVSFSQIGDYLIKEVKFGLPDFRPYR